MGQRRAHTEPLSPLPAYPLPRCRLAAAAAPTDKLRPWLPGVGVAGLGSSPLPGATPGVTPAARQRGASGGGDGVHVLTGPIYVNGAMPGDVLKVEILGLRPRPNPNMGGRTFGINAAAWWGYQYGVNGPTATSTTMTYLTPPPPPLPQQKKGANPEITTIYQAR